jgi:hypothetical protein
MTIRHPTATPGVVRPPSGARRSRLTFPGTGYLVRPFEYRNTPRSAAGCRVPVSGPPRSARSTTGHLNRQRAKGAHL